MKDIDTILGFISKGIVYVVGGFGWLTSVISDASNERFEWLLADVIFFPLGVIRGIFMWILVA